jgi:hypothetical protein
MIGADKLAAVRALADVNGYIEPADVVAAARDPNHLLHDEFEWNVNQAAQLQWIERARQLIRFVKLEVIIDHKTIRSVAYVADPRRPPKSRRYVDLTVAATHRAVSQEVLMAELQRIVDAIRRAREVAAVLGLTSQLDALLADVGELVNEVETRRAETKKKPAPKKKTATRKRRSSRPELRA